MKRKHLFFDLDGMKFDTLPAQVTYVNQRYGIKTSAMEYIGRNNDLELLLKNHIPDINLSRDEIYNDFGENFLTSIKLHENVLPMKDMCKVIKLLSEKYILWTVTARQKRGLHVIEYLLDKHIPGCIHGVHCVWGHTEEKGFSGVSKKDFIQSVSGEKVGFFDDSLHEIEEVKSIIPSFLFDHRGHYEDVDGATLVQSWKRIGELFL